jgi:hypothetical protein
MKVLSLELGGKTYTTTRITTYMSKQAMQISKDVIAFRKFGEEMQSTRASADDAWRLTQKAIEICRQKAHLICEVYGVSVDELEKALTNEKINEEIIKIQAGIKDRIMKNLKESKESPHDDEDVDELQVLNKIYHYCVKKFYWSLRDIDETDLETLMDFIFYREDADPNVRVISGKIYRRVKGVPTWL